MYVFLEGTIPFFIDLKADLRIITKSKPLSDISKQRITFFITRKTLFLAKHVHYLAFLEYPTHLESRLWSLLRTPLCFCLLLLSFKAIVHCSSRTFLVFCNCRPYPRPPFANSLALTELDLVFCSLSGGGPSFKDHGLMKATQERRMGSNIGQKIFRFHEMIKIITSVMLRRASEFYIVGVRTKRICAIPILKERRCVENRKPFRDIFAVRVEAETRRNIGRIVIRTDFDEY
jgi:hypothetical protein